MTECHDTEDIGECDFGKSIQMVCIQIIQINYIQSKLSE